MVLQTLVFSLGPGSELRQIRYCTTFFSPTDSDAMCLSDDLRLYQIPHSWDWFLFIVEWGPSYWYPLPFHSMSRKYTCPHFLLPHARWMPALIFSLTLRWRFSYLPWNFMWFFFLLPANLWTCVPATQCRKNLIIKIISQYIYIEYLLGRPYTKPMCCFVKSSQKPYDTGTLSLHFIYEETDMIAG